MEGKLSAHMNAEGCTASGLDGPGCKVYAPWEIPTRAEAENMIVKFTNDKNRIEKEQAQIMAIIDTLKIHPNESDSENSGLGVVSEDELS